MSTIECWTCRECLAHKIDFDGEVVARTAQEHKDTTGHTDVRLAQLQTSRRDPRTAPR